ncbi:Similar to RPA2: Replication protein A 32 kDa subunit (Pongo abelii) [Cotesia congregata]|uniref:Similar to RPA2: Replication protein A 32 kDa subunit (Pongo abelii) n=1 Tax=Cotesia congregata TaxID=51543 RepID=A0A8J2MSZ0_COTCN|nr:Similar to RPA2: Replication protein A 32 kDa subunit (Pongo abelii) [Cotesia congregata]
MWGNDSTSEGGGGGGFMDESYSTATPQADRGETKRSNNVIPLMISDVHKSGRHGTIMAFKWLEAESIPPEGIEVGMYVKIHGTIREQGGDNCHVFVMKIRPVKKYAEVFSHLLEIISISANMKYPKNTLHGKGVEAPTGNKAEDDDMNDDICHGLTNEQKILYKIIKSHDSENGIERNYLKTQVPKNLEAKVDVMLDFLASEGHIYTTCNDDFFKAT